jgi:nitrite reductase (NADH) small subunit
MAEYVVARVGELQPGQRKIVQVGRARIGLFRIGDAYYALPNVCPHQLGPLCEGKLGGAIIADAASGWEPEWRYDGEVVACPWHGLEFYVPTGQCLAYRHLRLRRYTVKVEGDEIKIVL